MNHPDLPTLALLAGRDLPFWKRWSLERHAAACPRCQADLALFRGDQAAFAALDTELPERWDRLAGEMKANIRLGLEASEAIAAFDHPSPLEDRRLSWRAALVVAALMVVLGTGWWFGVTRRQLREAPVAASIHQPAVVEASEGAVEIKDGEVGLGLLTPPTRASFVSVSTQGEAQTRYADGLTGQITVNNVYVD